MRTLGLVSITAYIFMLQKHAPISSHTLRKRGYLAVGVAARTSVIRAVILACMSRTTNLSIDPLTAKHFSNVIAVMSAYALYIRQASISRDVCIFRIIAGRDP
jgi:hypothetical protein